jgi:hypothetical protein
MIKAMIRITAAAVLRIRHLIDDVPAGDFLDRFGRNEGYLLTARKPSTGRLPIRCHALSENFYGIASLI